MAILAVLLLHLYVPAGPYLGVPYLWIDRIARNLTSGVDLFFVLSGFLLYSHLAAKPLTQRALLAYVEKRARRILPAYYVALIGAAIYVYDLSQSLLKAGQLEFAQKLIHSLNSVWADLIFVSNYSADRLLEPGWSLSVEVHFYLLLPLLVSLLQHAGHLRKLVLLVLFCIPTAIRLVFPDDSMSYFYTHTRFDGIVAGMIVADLFASDLFHTIRSSRPLKFLLACASLLLLLFGHLCEIDGLFYRTWRYTFFAGGFALLLLTALSSQTLRNMLSIAVLRFLARISYTLYLWHPIFLTIALRNLGVNQSSGPIHVFLSWGIALLAGAFGSALLYLIVEVPFQKRTESRSRET